MRSSPEAWMNDKGLALYLSPRFTPSDVSASGDRGLVPGITHG